jgi:ribonuclease HII
MLTIGVDDAGRGPLIGPMILGGVLVTKDQENKFKKLGVRDSKDLTQRDRVRFSKDVKTNSLSSKLVKVSPEEIDKVVLGEVGNLNILEAEKMAEVINSLNSGKYLKEKIRVYVDCPSTNTSTWQAKLMMYIKHIGNLDIICEHKADSNYVSVGAASILAKVMREEEVAKIKKEYGEIGSGYPSDPYTKKFLAENGKKLRDSGIFRKSWSTWKKMFPGKGQKTLGDW